MRSRYKLYQFLYNKYNVHNYINATLFIIVHNVYTAHSLNKKTKDKRGLFLIYDQIEKTSLKLIKNEIMQDLRIIRNNKDNFKSGVSDI